MEARSGEYEMGRNPGSVTKMYNFPWWQREIFGGSSGKYSVVAVGNIPWWQWEIFLGGSGKYSIGNNLVGNGYAALGLPPGYR